jgi:hypothetical protein
MEQYLNALSKHDASAIPLAKDVKFVENTKVTPVGKGLWETATGGPTQFKIFVHNAEPKVMKIIGVPGITERADNDRPFDLPAAHVFKILNGKIYEIEAIGYLEQHGVKNGWE